MINMPQIQSIREQYQKGSSVAEISRAFGVDPKTICKYVNQEDFSPQPPEKLIKGSILDPYKPIMHRSKPRGFFFSSEAKKAFRIKKPFIIGLLLPVTFSDPGSAVLVTPLLHD